MIQGRFLLFMPEHSMAETLTVALRVAEEAIDEAISKAEFENTSQVRIPHVISSSTLISLHSSCIRLPPTNSIVSVESSLVISFVCRHQIHLVCVILKQKERKTRLGRAHLSSKLNNPKRRLFLQGQVQMSVISQIKFNVISRNRRLGTLNDQLVINSVFELG